MRLLRRRSRGRTSQWRLRSHHGNQRLIRAVLVATPSAHADRSDHLAVYDDRQAARNWKYRQLVPAQLKAHVVGDLIGPGMRRIARVQDALRLEQSRLRVDRDLAVHAMRVHDLSRRAEDEHADRLVVLGGPVHARLRDLRRGVGRDLVLDQRLLGASSEMTNLLMFWAEIAPAAITNVAMM